MSKKALYFTLGTLFGTASGILAGMLLAPRSGAESRAMAADAMNDVWDSAVDTYERGAQTAADKFNGVRPVVDATCAPRSTWPASAWTSCATPSPTW